MVLNEREREREREREQTKQEGVKTSVGHVFIN